MTYLEQPKTLCTPVRPVVAALLSLCVALPSLAATFTVNDVSDAGDAVPGDGICATAGGVCTLRAAMEEANALAGADTILFNVGGGGAVTIAPAAALPFLTGTTHIDGYSQPGSSANTLATGNDAVVNVRLDGGNTVTNAVFFLGAPGSSVRGLAVTRFTATGITVNGSSGTTVAGNLVGTDGTGADLHNGAFGVLVYSNSDDVVVGGATPADRNVIAWNLADGIAVSGTNVSGTLVRNNYIGTSPNGLIAHVNSDHGVSITGASSTVVRNNVIASGLSAILLAEGGTNQTTVIGNFIGVGADGVASLGGTRGVEVLSSASGAPDTVWLGGDKSDEGNVIANMLAEGVRVDRGSAAHPAAPMNVGIRGNAIYNNGGLGIDLADSATGRGVGAPNANDLGDVDSGANNFQNFPVLTAATTNGVQTSASFIYSSYANGGAFVVDAYASPACDLSGYGEGRVYLGSTSVVTDANGNASGTLTGLPATTPGHYLTLTATATDIGLFMNTSEFSACMAVVGDGVVGGGAKPVPALGVVGQCLAALGVALAGLFARRTRARAPV